MALKYEDIAQEFKDAVNGDKQVQKYLRTIRDKKGTYVTANKLAIRVGQDLGKVLMNHAPYENIDEWDLIDLIPKSLGLDHQLIADACKEVQETMNKDAGLRLKYKEPQFNMDRVHGLIVELQDNPEFTNIEKTFVDQIVNFSEGVVDDSIRENAGLMFRSGIRTVVVRQAEFGGCKWCQAVAGVYDYNEVSDKGNDVWRRHENCKCTIDFHTERTSERVYNYKETERNTK